MVEQPRPTFEKRKHFLEIQRARQNERQTPQTASEDLLLLLSVYLISKVLSCSSHQQKREPNGGVEPPTFRSDN